MSRQKKWWWVSANTLTTSTKHRKDTPVISPTIAQETASATPQHEDQSTWAVVGNQVVLTGIDTLAVTAGGVSAPSTWLQEQSVIWNEYQNQYQFGDDYVCIEIDGKWWQLYPNGSVPYKYQLRNDEIGFIKVWNVDKWSSGVTGKQQIHIHFYSKFLHSYPIDTLYHQIENITSIFFADDSYDINTSRGDIHADVTNGKSFLSVDDISNVISRSKVRQHYYENQELELSAEELDFLSPLTNNKGGQKLIPTSVLEKLNRMYYQQTNVGANNIVMKRELETAYFGKSKGGDLWCKMYNKSKQVKVKCDTDTPLLWMENGWNGDDTVVRVEFSIRRGALKDMDDGKYIPLKSFLSEINTLWKYLTDKWCRMVEEVKTNNSTWSKVTQFWSVIQSAFITPTKNIIRKKSYKAKLNQLFLQGVGCLKQMISFGMMNNQDWCYVKSAITAVENTLTSSIEDGEYYSRRQLLGIA